jgi:hypothetical protein
MSARKTANRSAITTAAGLVKKFSGPAANVFSCPYCREKAVVSKRGLGRFIGPGAWASMCAGGASKVSAHILAQHRPEVVRAMTARLADLDAFLADAPGQNVSPHAVERVEAEASGLREALSKEF